MCWTIVNSPRTEVSEVESRQRIDYGTSIRSDPPERPSLDVGAWSATKSTRTVG
jgi:hypothetical protein